MGDALEIKDSSLQDEQYKIMTMIDYGSFGDIYKIFSLSEKKIYAMKQIVFRGIVTDDPYIMSEIWCLNNVRHKNIIQLRDIMLRDNRVDIIMEYAEKENLEKVCLDEGPLSMTFILDIYSQILEGVNYIHSYGVAHRDLTPGNILLTRNNVVKIADFGLAVRCCSEDGCVDILCTDFLGNTSYLAPEVLTRTHFLARPADIWSLGILLCYIVYLDVPYKGLEPKVLQDQMEQTWREFVKRFTDNVEKSNLVGQVLEKCLVINPILRVTIGELLKHLTMNT
ncbi:hypothetical protein CHS0354_005904 [Potamilus streckersoni]|uniref:Protein kinase domain-containing protein n=1 Tax=Potamilus streckersoni TaxID=2493646 RepID=A0AAE0T383_9BIVA|nr:hypothetical protein CHS0354_005904 [Potamilus streckersoni]